MIIGAVNPKKYVYHFTTKEKALEGEGILSSGQLKFGSAADTNDPRERHWFICPTGAPEQDDSRIAVLNHSIHYFKRRCKILCLSQDHPENSQSGDPFGRAYSYARMWAQYADNHRGLCLVFDRDKLEAKTIHQLNGDGEIHHGSINYRNPAVSSDSAFEISYELLKDKHIGHKAIEETIDKNIDRYFFEKNVDWEGEREYRWVVIPMACDHFSIPIDGAIKAVILGSGFPEVYEVSVKDTCKDYSLKTYRMYWRNGFPLVKEI